MDHAAVPGSLKLILAAVILVYVAAMFALSLFAEKKIQNEEDYIVAGRRLPLSLAWATLLATWFGAGTLLTASTEVAREGIRKATLDPIGAGLCLIIAGFWIARPLWKMQLLTLSDFFRRRYGPSAEVLSAILLIPTYLGWIAAQFVALAHVLNLFFDLPLPIGILLVAIVGTGYTLIGGMWSVTLTDAVQITMVLIGLIILTASCLSNIGGGNPVLGFTTVIGTLEQQSPEKLVLIPTESAPAFWGWVSVLCAGSLGNLPGQDLMQRIFSSKSPEVAQQACWLAGTAYLTFGALPILMGLVAATQYGGEVTDTVLPALANSFMHPALTVVFVVVLMSAVISTIDSAILSPATVMAQNLFGRLKEKGMSGLAVNRMCVLMVACCSLAMAYTGERAYALLENAYSLAMVALFVPLVMGLHTNPRNALPGVTAMVVGVGVWFPQYLSGWHYFLEGFEPIGHIGISLSLSATTCAFVGYMIVHLLQVYYLRYPARPAEEV